MTIKMSSPQATPLSAAKRRPNGTDEEAGRGQFLEGKEPRFKDFVVISALECLKRCKRDVFDGILERCEGLKEAYEACRPWLVRDD